MPFILMITIFAFDAATLLIFAAICFLRHTPFTLIFALFIADAADAIRCTPRLCLPP